MAVMTTANPPPEGIALEAARTRSHLSQRAAAKRAGMSETRWRQITKGGHITQGVYVPDVGPPETIARMARAVDLDPDLLIKSGRDDAYASWIVLRNADRVSATATSEGLAGYSSGALLAELGRRLTSIGSTSRSDLPDDLDTGALPQPSAKDIGAEQAARPWASHNRSDARPHTGTRSGDDTPPSMTP